MRTLSLCSGCLTFQVDGKNVHLDSTFDRATCPSCGQAGCCNDCDGSQGADENNQEEEEDAIARQRYNAGVDTVESLLLALVSSGAITESEDPKVNEAIQSCLDAIGHRFLG